MVLFTSFKHGKYNFSTENLDFNMTKRNINQERERNEK